MSRPARRSPFRRRRAGARARGRRTRSPPDSSRSSTQSRRRRRRGETASGAAAGRGGRTRCRVASIMPPRSNSTYVGFAKRLESRSRRMRSPFVTSPQSASERFRYSCTSACGLRRALARWPERIVDRDDVDGWSVGVVARAVRDREGLASDVRGRRRVDQIESEALQQGDDPPGARQRGRGSPWRR